MDCSAAIRSSVGIQDHHRAKSLALRKMRNRNYKMDKLPRGAVTAVRASNWRIPDDAPEEARQLAQQALERIADVMHGRVPIERQAAVLKAATDLRAEVCGPPAQRLEVKGKMGLMALLTAAAAIEEKADDHPILDTVATPALPAPSGRLPVATGPTIRKKVTNA